MPKPSPRQVKLPHSTRVLIVVDFINPLDFPGAEKLAPPALKAARATARLRDRLGERGVPVIYANDNWGVWQSDFQSLVAELSGRDDTAGKIVRLLAPRVTDLTLLKPRHSAFFASPLELLLDEMQARELVLCGLATDMCLQMTAADAFLRNYDKVWVPSDCTAAETSKAKADALRYMAAVLKCDVRASAALLRAWA